MCNLMHSLVRYICTTRWEASSGLHHCASDKIRLEPPLLAAFRPCVACFEIRVTYR